MAWSSSFIGGGAPVCQSWNVVSTVRSSTTLCLGSDTAYDSALGLTLQQFAGLTERLGPVIDAPIRTAADVARLRLPESPDDAYASLLGAIRIVRGELAAEQAVVGFCGGPFTVAGYLVEGKPSRDFARTKALMYGQPETWHAE